MKIQAVKNHIFSLLDPFAAANGFKVVKSRFAFSRAVGNRKDEIFFTYNSWGFEVQLFPYVSVDFEDVTSICNECDFNLNHTAFINLRLLQEIKLHGFNPDLRWQMQVDDTDRFILSDDAPAFDQLDEKLPQLMTLALDFISQYNNIKSIDQLFNARPIELYCPYCSGLDTHCMVGLISAKISNNAEYENIKQMYHRIVKRDDFAREMKTSFSRVIAYLEQI